MALKTKKMNFFLWFISSEFKLKGSSNFFSKLLYFIFNAHDVDHDHGYGEEPRKLLLDKKENEFIAKAKEWVRQYAKVDDIEQ